MEIVNMSSNKFKSLKGLELANNILSTECELFKFNYRGEAKVFKKLYNTDGIKFANKLYTLESLNDSKNYIPNNFILPEFLVAINRRIEGFSMKYVDGVNLSNILNDIKIEIPEKKYYLMEIGRILKQMKTIRAGTSLKDFYLGDLHEDNFLVNPCSKEMFVADLDSCKIRGNQSSPARYLTPMALFNEVDTSKYLRTINDSLTDFEVNENTDIYCYTIIILNYLYNGKINNIGIEEFYRFINYLNDIGIDKELIQCFNKILMYGDNINPCDYIDTLTPKQICQARKLYKK